MSTQSSRNEFYDAAVQSLGGFGRIRLDAGETYDNENGEILVVKAFNGDATYAAGCVAYRGEAPAAADIVQQGTFDEWPGKTIVLDGASEGSLWLYPKQKQLDN